MYEGITYAELKSLPKEQKSIAWKELKTMYSTQKELAEKLGVSPAIVYNMVSRYAREDSASGEKGNGLEAAEIPEKESIRAKRQKIREKLVRNTVVVGSAPAEPVAAPVAGMDDEAFSIRIAKTATGEDAQLFLNGVGSALLKNRTYSIELKIAEK